MLCLQLPAPVDFSALLLDLRRQGMTDREIAEAAGMKRGTMHAYLSRQARPNHRTGESLVSAWCQIMGRAREDVPRQASRELSAAKFSRESRGPVDVFSSESTAPVAAALSGVTRAWSSAALVA